LNLQSIKRGDWNESIGHAGPTVKEKCNRESCVLILARYSTNTDLGETIAEGTCFGYLRYSHLQIFGRRALVNIGEYRDRNSDFLRRMRSSTKSSAVVSARAGVSDSVPLKYTRHRTDRERLPKAFIAMRRQVRELLASPVSARNKGKES
jgi:hypothetical protein